MAGAGGPFRSSPEGTAGLETSEILVSSPPLNKEPKRNYIGVCRGMEKKRKLRYYVGGYI